MTLKNKLTDGMTLDDIIDVNKVMEYIYSDDNETVTSIWSVLNNTIDGTHSNSYAQCQWQIGLAPIIKSLKNIDN